MKHSFGIEVSKAVLIGISQFVVIIPMLFFVRGAVKGLEFSDRMDLM